jgi:hypothetical protein
MVARDEGLHIAATGNVVTQDWDAAWDSDDQQETIVPPGVNRTSLEEERKLSEVTTSITSPTTDADAADAWGWGGMLNVFSGLSFIMRLSNSVPRSRNANFETFQMMTSPKLMIPRHHLTLSRQIHPKLIANSPLKHEK